MKQVERIVDELRRIGALREVQRFLRDRQLDSARAWDGILERLSSFVRDGSIELDELLDFYARVRVVGGKAYALYEMPKAVRRRLLKLDPSEEKNVFAKAFPHPVEESALENAPERPKLAGRVDSELGSALVFCSARLYRWRDEIPPEDLAPRVRDDYKGARLFAEYVQYFQAFDVVFIPRDEDSLVQTRVDVGQQGITESLDDLRLHLERAVSELAGGSAEKYFAFLPTCFPQ